MSFISAEFPLFLALGLLIFQLVPTGRRSEVLLVLSAPFSLSGAFAPAVLVLAVIVAICFIEHYETEHQKHQPTPTNRILSITSRRGAK